MQMKIKSLEEIHNILRFFAANLKRQNIIVKN